jgi:hypothetical protein
VINVSAGGGLIPVFPIRAGASVPEDVALPAEAAGAGNGAGDAEAALTAAEAGPAEAPGPPARAKGGRKRSGS